MDILPPSKPGDRFFKPRPASNVMLRPLVSSAEPVKSSSAPVILPSIRSSDRTGSTISHVAPSGITTKGMPTLAGTAPKEKKRGRPTKAEKMRERRARVSEGIKALVDDDPTKTEVHAYFEERIKELLAEA